VSGGITAADIATLSDRVARWRACPADFVREEFRPHELGRLTPDGIDPAQHELLALLPSQAPGEQYVAQQAATGTAKTVGMSWTGLWHMVVHGDGARYPNGAALSITEKNLHDNLVREMAYWRGRSRLCSLLLDLNATRLARRDAPDKAFISFRAYPKGAGGEEAAAALSGIHGPYCVALLDETGTMPPAVGRKVQQIPTEGQVYFKALASGNPDSNDGLLHEIATNLRATWRLIVVTGDPDDPNRSPRVPIEKARHAIATYGRDNAWVRIYILGQFPLTALNKFLGPDDIALAQRRACQAADVAWSQNRLAIDPARFGDDRTGIVRRQGLAMFPSWHMRGRRGSEIAAFVADLNANPDVGPFDLIVVEMGSENSGAVFDGLKAGGLPVHAVYQSGASPDPRFYNLRAYMHWHAADWVKTRGCFPKDEALAREALAPMYDYKSGKLIVESKDDIKERLQESPDLWDSACMTFALPDAPRNLNVPARARGGHGTVRVVVDS